MRIRLFILFLVIIPLFVACQMKKEGGYQFRRVYILEGEKIIDAQNHEVQFGLEGGQVTLEYVGPSSFSIVGLSATSGVIVETVDNAKPLDNTFNDDRDSYTWFMQTVLINANPTTSFRKVQCYVVSDAANGFAAPLTIIQSN